MSEERQTTPRTALTEAQAIIDAAKRRAAEILQEADRQFREGYESGYETGKEQGLRDTAQAAMRLMKESARVKEMLAEQAAKLALAICEKILAEQLTVEPDLVVGLARRTLKGAILGDDVKIIAHPEDLARLKAAEKELRKAAEGAHISFEGDDLVARGGCIVKSDFGEVDASLTALLERVSQSFGLNGSE